MTDVWSGDILLPDGNVIREIGLSSPNITSLLPIPSTTLRFLSTVETARIPLYLAAGPSLDVWTTSEDTESWFQSLLHSKLAASTETPSAATTHQWWHLARSQSPIGILAQIQNGNEDTQKLGITEILFYGTIASPPSRSIPTPPSSSPQVHTGPDEDLPEFQVHALPLSSHLLHHQDAEPTINSGPQFLPAQYKFKPTPTSPRRKRDIFEEATIANKKAKGRGGKNVAAVAARVSDSQQPYVRPTSRSIDSKTTPFPDFRPSSANGALARSNARPLSRSPSISSETRPLSRKDIPDGQVKRSNLSQVATTSQSEEPTTESRNKEALSKVVMAAMRMHGLQQRKKHKPGRVTGALGMEEGERLGENALNEEAAKDDEYKLIYHQTFKGATLALRRHMSEKPLHAQSDLLRDVVEKLLTIFMTDPIAAAFSSNASGDSAVTPARKNNSIAPGSTHSHASPFDLPSAARSGAVKSTTDTPAYNGSPMSRKRLDPS